MGKACVFVTHGELRGASGGACGGGGGWGGQTLSKRSRAREGCTGSGSGDDGNGCIEGVSAGGGRMDIVGACADAIDFGRGGGGGSGACGTDTLASLQMAH